LTQVELEFPALETQSALPNAKLSYVAPRSVSQIADQAKQRPNNRPEPLSYAFCNEPLERLGLTDHQEGYGRAFIVRELAVSRFPGAFGDEAGRRRRPILQFLCKAGFTKPQGLFLSGPNDGVEFVDGAVASEELRLSIAEGYLCLLARFAVCLCHSISWIEDRDLSRQ
jgi:hypothetical protein